VTIAWSMAMVRNQYGVSMNVIRAFLEGLQLPWLNTFGKMATQYAPWLEGRPSPMLSFLLVGAVVAGIWIYRNPWSPYAGTAGR
jgi:hypothetical protein